MPIIGHLEKYHSYIDKDANPKIGKFIFNAKLRILPYVVPQKQFYFMKKLLINIGKKF